MKRKIVFLLSVILILACALFIGCNSAETPVELELSLNKTSLSMIIGGKETITATHSEIKEDGYELTWTSNNEAVAKVNKGVVEACGVGNAVITAKYGNSEKYIEKTAEVLVGADNFSAVLGFENLKDQETVWNFSVNDKYLLLPYVSFNGVKYYDVALTVDIEDATVAKAENNELTFLQKGTTQITFNVEWRGLTVSENPLLSYTVDVEVFDVVYMYLNNQGVDDIDLYVVDEFEGKALDSVISFEARVEENGVVSQHEVEIEIEDDSVVGLADGKLSAKKYGQTNITLSWQKGTESEIVKTLAVKVNCPEVLDVIDIDLSAGKFITDSNYFENRTITEVYENGKSVNLYEGGSLSGLSVNYDSQLDDVKKTPLVIMFDDGLKLQYSNVKAYTKVFSQENKDEIEATFSTNSTATHSGYYALSSDIDGISFTTNRATADIFNGTFDGRGHVIKNVQVKGAGLFGNFGDGATVKNVAFTNVSFSRSNNVSERLALLFNTPSVKGVSVRLENVYVGTNEITTDLLNNDGGSGVGHAFISVIAATTMSSTNLPTTWTINNVIIESAVSADCKFRAGRFGIISDEANEFSALTSINNFYVISNAPRAVDVSNIGADSIIAKNVKEYNSVIDMSLAENDYSSFSKVEYWAVTEDSIPVWSSITNIVVTNSKDKTVSTNSLMLFNATEESYTIKLSKGGKVVIPNITTNASEISINGNVISATTISEIKIVPISVTYEDFSVVLNVQLYSAPRNDVNEDIMLDTSTGELLLPTSLKDKVISNVRQNGTSILSAGKINGIEPVIKADRTGVDSVELLVEFTDGSIYMFNNVKPCTKVFTQDNKDQIVATFSTNTNAKNTGYYVLDSDIDGIAFTTSNTNIDTFAGVFDGRGYTINNIEAKGFGLFGNIGDGASLRNVAFTNVNFSRDGRHRIALMFNDVVSGGISAYLENIYVQVNEIPNTVLNDETYAYISVVAATTMSSWSKKTTWTINNVLVDAPLQEGCKYKATRMGIITDEAQAFNAATSITNLYCISNAPKASTLQWVGPDSVLTTNLNQYATKAEMIAANNNYKSFIDSAYWTVETGGIPEWNTPVK